MTVNYRTRKSKLINMQTQKIQAGQRPPKQLTHQLLTSKKKILNRVAEKLVSENKDSHCGHTDNFVNSPL